MSDTKDFRTYLFDLNRNYNTLLGIDLKTFIDAAVEVRPRLKK